MSLYAHAEGGWGIRERPGGLERNNPTSSVQFSGVLEIGVLLAVSPGGE